MKKKPKKKKLPKWRTSRDPTDRLIVAADNWVKKHGGAAVIMGPVSIMTYPMAPEHEYFVIIKCCGRKPEKPKSP